MVSAASRPACVAVSVGRIVGDIGIGIGRGGGAGIDASAAGTGWLSGMGPSSARISAALCGLSFGSTASARSIARRKRSL